jgi:hydroxymethylbilane synthase
MQHESLTQSGAMETVVIKTTGDKEQGRLLSEIGGKGLFTKELDEAMLRGEIDIGIHSMKDMPTVMPDGIMLHAITQRLDPRDALISQKAKTLAELPKGATVGTASLRRKAQLLYLRPDLRIIPLRGNIDTRLKKITNGEIDATLLAFAGLSRLEKENNISGVIDFTEVLPAVGQGVLAATCREGDLRATMLIKSLLHPATTIAVLAERAMLAALDGSCQTPIAGYSKIEEDQELTLCGIILRPDGTEKAEVKLSGNVNEAEKLGAKVAEKLIIEAGSSLLRAIKQERPIIIEAPMQIDPETDVHLNNSEDR